MIQKRNQYVGNELIHQYTWKESGRGNNESVKRF